MMASVTRSDRMQPAAWALREPAACIRAPAPGESGPMKKILAQQIGFQFVWLCCALGGASGLSWPGALACAAFLALCITALPSATERGRVLALSAAAVATGLALDAVLVGGGWLRYAGDPLRLGASPLWILALWAAFAPTLPVAFGWLRGRPALGALAGAAGGALAHAAGERLGALGVAEGAGLAAVALAWGAAMPALVAASAWLERAPTGADADARPVAS